MQFPHHVVLQWLDQPRLKDLHNEARYDYRLNCSFFGTSGCFLFKGTSQLLKCPSFLGTVFHRSPIIEQNSLAFPSFNCTSDTRSPAKALSVAICPTTIFTSSTESGSIYGKGDGCLMSYVF